MNKNIFKAIFVMAIMAVSLPSFGQEIATSGTINITPSGIVLDVEAFFPAPTYINNIIEQTTATVTWYDASGTAVETQTFSGTKVGDLQWEFKGFWTKKAVTHVTYKVWGANGAGTAGYETEGTYYLYNGSLLVITQWKYQWGTFKPPTNGM